LNDYAVLIGACGWQHTQWGTSYYPEELPPEWQLAYYGNEYPLVLIPAEYWAQGSGAIAQWCEETEERPRFVCEWPLQELDVRRDTISAALDQLGDRVEAVLLSVTDAPDTAQLEAIRRMASAYAVCLDWPQANAQMLTDVLSGLVQGRGVSACWRGDAAAKSLLEFGPVAVARINSSGQTPRSLRSLLETLLASAGQRQAMLLFDGDPPDTEIMDQAEVILNLL